MSEELREFFQLYLDWVKAGAWPDEEFCTYFGLCGNLRRYSGYTSEIGNELHDILYEMYTDVDYPFNEGCSTNYQLEMRTESCHTNPKRLAFVKQQLGE